MMKGRGFVVFLALNCFIITCGALKCPSCTLLDSRAACLQAAQVTCNGTDTYCRTIQAKNEVLGGEKWTNACGTKSACDAGKITNKSGACKPNETTSVCIYCCNTDGCVGQPATGAAVTTPVSIVTMATITMVILLKNAAGF
ncbi:uncharacterized protein LOC118428700 [Branchiostoma floridae]|uniref:Uncharacterized protein LOC118428700 n=1 Tax=Branchiostoma floridae TaxID=7739 RepID=C3Y8U8_BRAFL|nr:uncharacterized protein LOC118428700 [Branchiostoma floridae]|eukprot:XP_002606994.1 hypothetical protein BRAFLDRAFT_117591 [Branchiostoma floridae]